jgi:hypothetical protein
MADGLITWLQNEIATSDSGGGRPGKATLIEFHDMIEPILKEAWAKVQIRGWKGDWVRAAKHVFLGHIVSASITHTGQVASKHLAMVTRWLQGLQPTWTSADPSALDQAINAIDRKQEITELVTVTLWKEVWLRAEFYLDDREQRRTARAPSPLQKEVA